MNIFSGFEEHSESESLFDFFFVIIITKHTILYAMVVVIIHRKINKITKKITNNFFALNSYDTRSSWTSAYVILPIFSGLRSITSNFQTFSNIFATKNLPRYNSL